MRAVLLIILASLALGCVSSTRTREVHCFGSLMLEVWTSQEKLDLLEADWRTAWKARSLTARQSPPCVLSCRQWQQYGRVYAYNQG